MERATALSAGPESENGEARTIRTRLRHSVRSRQALVAAATVVAALSVATPAMAWPMCGG